jgi:predicted ABC-type ATPase
VSDPVLHVLAGPNGAGKTTFFRLVLEPVTHLPFVNADLIAAERWPDAAEQRGYEAAALAAEERTALLVQRRSFATETVFSHASKLDLLRNAKAASYRVTLHVVLIPADLAVARVRDRVSNGGHSVPEDKVRARFARLWLHVREAIDVVDEVYVYDNTKASTPFRLIASYLDGQLVGAARWPKWTPPDLR